MAQKLSIIDLFNYRIIEILSAFSNLIRAAGWQSIAGRRAGLRRAGNSSGQFILPVH